jgi:hypothetical protein
MFAARSQVLSLVVVAGAMPVIETDKLAYAQMLSSKSVLRRCANALYSTWASAGSVNRKIAPRGTFAVAHKLP